MEHLYNLRRREKKVALTINVDVRRCIDIS